MANFKVKIIGSNGFYKGEINRIQNLSERQLKNIAKDTESAMRNNVESSITRANSSGNLEKSINAEKIVGGWGVGNIDYMNNVAPYWRHVNYGSTAIGADHNHRVPQGAFSPGGSPSAGGSGGRWTVGGGTFSFIPTKPIAPLNYISKTLQDIPNIISKNLRRN